MRPCVVLSPPLTSDLYNPASHPDLRAELVVLRAAGPLPVRRGVGGAGVPRHAARRRGEDPRPGGQRAQHGRRRPPGLRGKHPQTLNFSLPSDRLHSLTVRW